MITEEDLMQILYDYIDDLSVDEKIVLYNRIEHSQLKVDDIVWSE